MLLTAAFILLLVAAVVFAVDALRPPGSLHPVSLGLCLVALALACWVATRLPR